MAKWIRTTAVEPPRNLLVLRLDAPEDETHHCQPPLSVEVGPKSIWECDCGNRWRISAPYWRPLRTHPAPRGEVPSWVATLSDDLLDADEA